MKTILYKNEPLLASINATPAGHSFIYEDGVPACITKMDVSISFCDSRIEVTTELKRFFEQYSSSFPDVFESKNRRDVDLEDLYLMIDQWAKDNNIKYAGWSDKNNCINKENVELYVWLPIIYKGRFIFMASNQNNDHGRIGYNDGSKPKIAHLLVGFIETEIPSVEDTQTWTCEYKGNKYTHGFVNGIKIESLKEQRDNLQRMINNHNIFFTMKSGNKGINSN